MKGGAKLCAHCRKPHGKSVGNVNRSIKVGAPIFCGRKCFGLSRRQYKTKAQKVEEKRIYDAEYHAKNREMLKAKKQVRHMLTYDPVKASIARRKRMPWHVEYCRRPEYKAWKHEYDKKYNAKATFGPFWEAALALQEVENEVSKRASRYEIMLANGTINKAFQRRRNYENQTGRTHRH